MISQIQLAKEFNTMFMTYCSVREHTPERKINIVSYSIRRDRDVTDPGL